MKQVLRKGLKDIVVEELPDPIAAPHQVLVRPVSSLISSGTETASIHREGVLKKVAEDPSQIQKIWRVLQATDPVRTLAEVRAKFSEYAVLGYSGAGIVQDCHATVTDLRPGDRVAYGGEGTGHGECIATGRQLVARIPSPVPYDDAAFTTLGAIALNTVRAAELTLGDVAVVLGLGLLGQLISQLARLQGAVVIAADLRPERVELARALGAHHALSADAALREAVAPVSAGRGADAVIVAASSKSSAPCRQALEVCRDRGRIVVAGAVDLTFPWNEMYLKEIRLTMARAYGPGSYDQLYERDAQDYPVAYVRWTENRNMEEFLRLLENGQVQVAQLITHRLPLERAPEAYDVILARGSSSLAVILQYAQPEQRPAPRRRIELAAPRSGPPGIRVALVGAGNIARWAHMPALKSVRDVSLRAVYSAGPVRARNYAQRFGASYCCTDYEEILADPDIDAVLITTRNQLHARQAAAALRAGKHVFVEKPMAITEAECRLVYDAARDSGRHLAVGFNRRFAPDYVSLGALLAKRSGPAVLSARVNSPGISGGYWMADPAIGGAIIGEATHFTDLFYWLLRSEPTTVSAYSLPASLKEPVGLNNLVASFGFEDGSLASLVYCTVGNMASGGGERVEAFAPGVGAFTEDFRCNGLAGPSRRQHSRWFAAKGYDAQLASFFATIRGEEEPKVTALDGVRSTMVCLRMLEAAASGAPHSLDWQAVLAP